MNLKNLLKSFVLISFALNFSVYAKTVISYSEIKDSIENLNKNIIISSRTDSNEEKEIPLKNNKMCKTIDFMHFLSDDDSLYWDGKCKDGSPFGLGRVYIRSHNGYDYTKNVDVLANYVSKDKVEPILLIDYKDKRIEFIKNVNGILYVGAKAFLDDGDVLFERSYIKDDVGSFLYVSYQNHQRSIKRQYGAYSLVEYNYFDKVFGESHKGILNIDSEYVIFKSINNKVAKIDKDLNFVDGDFIIDEKYMKEFESLITDSKQSLKDNTFNLIEKDIIDNISRKYKNNICPLKTKQLADLWTGEFVDLCNFKESYTRLFKDSMKKADAILKDNDKKVDSADISYLNDKILRSVFLNIDK